jgi:hypothetical protein
MAHDHPGWCEDHDDGIHRSRRYSTSRPGDKPIEVHAFLWQSGHYVGVGLDFTVEGARDVFLIDLGQARILRHVLLRLLDLAGAGRG